MSPATPPALLAVALLAAALLPARALPAPDAQAPDFSPRKIVLLHLHDDAPFFSQLGAVTLSNKRRYAAHHGYELASHSPQGTHGLWRRGECDAEGAVRPPLAQPPAPEGGGDCVLPDKSFSIDQRAPTFGKIKLTLAACRTRPDYWVLWSDADALIVNQTVPLEDIIDDAYDIMLTVDWLMINAGVILFKCSDWAKRFLERVYAAREFDSARALDQSAFQHFFDTEPGMDERLKRIPKHAINVYAEEYRAGDFLVHMAGKLYESTTKGAVAIANQYDMLSEIDNVEDVSSFFHGPYLLNRYNGLCDGSDGKKRCQGSEDGGRMKLDEPLEAMSTPNRYRHVGLRYYWLQDWKDVYDTEGWNDGRVLFDPSGVMRGRSADAIAEGTEEPTHDEL